MKELYSAIIGFVRLGCVCLCALRSSDVNMPKNVVRRPNTPMNLLEPSIFIPVAAQAGNPDRVDAALLGVSADATFGVARECARNDYPRIEQFAKTIDSLPPW